MDAQVDPDGLIAETLEPDNSTCSAPVPRSALIATRGSAGTADTMSEVSASRPRTARPPRPGAGGDEGRPVGGQAVLEGVMMRGVSTWAVAVRKPSAEQLDAGGPDSKEGAKGEIEVISEPLVSWTKRHRVLRLPVIRGVVALAESLKIGFKALGISANAQIPPDEEGEQKELGGGAWAGTIAFALLFAVGLFFLLPAGLTNLFGDSIPNGLVFVLIEKLDPDLDLPRLPLADLAHAGPPARLPVPRRRAQDHLVLRGGPAAHPGERPQSRASTRAAAPASS